VDQIGELADVARGERDFHALCGGAQASKRGARLFPGSDDKCGLSSTRGIHPPIFAVSAGRATYRRSDRGFTDSQSGALQNGNERVSARSSLKGQDWDIVWRTIAVQAHAGSASCMPILGRDIMKLVATTTSIFNEPGKSSENIALRLVDALYRLATGGPT
jgi:hypothetical protein